MGRTYIRIFEVLFIIHLFIGMWLPAFLILAVFPGSAIIIYHLSSRMESLEEDTDNE